MNKMKTYIESGILEMYVSCVAIDKETEEVMRMAFCTRGFSVKLKRSVWPYTLIKSFRN